MGVHEGSGLVAKAVKELAAAWMEAKLNWDDARSRDIESRFMMELERDARTAINAMGQMARIIDGAKRDCSDPG
jgi:hypothetical protein